MDVTQRKLQFPHPFVQIQAVQQITAAIRRKKQGKTDKCDQELRFLWEKCCKPENENVGHACVVALVTLVEEQVLDGNEVISTAVNHASSSWTPDFLLQLIGQLLKLHVLSHHDKVDGTFQCPYNLRAPPHPFISVLTSKPNSWSSVCGLIGQLLDECVTDGPACPAGPVMLEMLKPVLFYILLNPADSQEVRLGRCTLLECLTAHAWHLNVFAKGEMLSKLVDDILWPCLAHNDVTRRTVTFYINIVGLLQSKGKIVVKKSEYATVVFLKLLKFCGSQVSPCDKMFAIRTLKKMVRFFEKGFSENLGICIIGIVKVLNSVPLMILTALIPLLNIFIDHGVKTIPVCHLHFVHTSLVQIQLYVGIGAVSPKVKLMVDKLMKLVEDLIENNSGSSEARCKLLPETCILDKWATRLMADFELSRKQLSGNKWSHRWLRNIEVSMTQHDSWDDFDVSSITFLHCILLLRVASAKSEESSLYKDNVHKILNNVKLIVKLFPHCSYSILPILLVCMKKSSASLKHEICLTLPHLASHPYCVTPILNIVQSLATDQQLKPLALRLMLEVWTIQDRCYPQLQKMMTTHDIGLKLRPGNTDIQLMKAVAANKICAERPQYGSDMLKIIKPIVIASTSSSVGRAKKALALDGLYHLCSSKVLDIRSMWSELGDSLRRETAGIVGKKVLDILSLVPEFKWDTAAEEELKSEILQWIWARGVEGDAEVQSGVLRCLSQFDWQDFKIGQLPPPLCPETPDDVEDVDFFDRAVPGQCYMSLVKLAKGIDGQDIETFLTSLLRQELENLPRDIHHRAMKSQWRAARPEPLRGIPEFVLNLYERNRQPNLKASLAFSLLLCHNPTPESDRAGKPMPKSVISLGRNFMQIMQALLKEVPIEPNSWQSVLWCSHGWKIFMKRCLVAMLESRRAELAMQLVRAQKEGGEEDVADIEQKQVTALLWCRDKITNALKTASKGNPIMQGNAVFALASLVMAVASDDVTDSSEDKGDSEYLSMSHWIVMAIDTVITIANPTHVATGRIFSWCQFRSVSLTGRLTTTQLGKVCALQSLPLLVRMAVPTHNGKIMEMVKFLLKEREDDANNLAFHCSLSLGQIVGALYLENFEEVGGQGGSFLLSECFGRLEKSVNDANAGGYDDLGSLIGFGLALASRLQLGDTLFASQAKSTLLNLLNHLKTKDESRQYTQTLCTVLSWGYVSGVAQNIIDRKEAMELVDAMAECVQETPYNPGLTEALGTLCNGLYLSGHSGVIHEMDILFNQWYQTLSKDQVPTRERLSALSGAAALVGSNCTIMPQAIDTSMLMMAQYVTKLTTVIKVLKHFSRNSKDAGVPTKSIELLSRFYISFESMSGVISSAVPPSYDYLPHTSILKCVFEYIAGAVKAADSGSTELLKPALNSVSKNALKLKFPPVNWVSAFSPLLSGSSDDTVKNLVMEIAVAFCTDSPTLAAFLSSWISHPKFETLPPSAKTMLYSNVDKLVRCQEPKVIQGFIGSAVKQCLVALKEGASEMPVAFLTGVKDALLQSTQLSENAVENLLSCVENFFNDLHFDYNVPANIAGLSSLAQCLLRHPQGDTIIGKFEQDGSEPSDLLKSVFVRCWCVLNGGHSLSMSNNAIECCGRCEATHEAALSMIAVCFQGFAHKAGTANDRLEWMQEIMGKLKTLVKSSATEDMRLTAFLLNVYSVAVVCWSGLGVNLGISGQYGDGDELGSLTVIDVSSVLPIALERLLSQKQWSRLVQPSIDWVLFLRQSLRDKDWLKIFSNLLYSLRKTKAYQSPSVWCEVAMSIHNLK